MLILCKDVFSIKTRFISNIPLTAFEKSNFLISQNAWIWINFIFENIFIKFTIQHAIYFNRWSTSNQIKCSFSAFFRRNTAPFMRLSLVLFPEKSFKSSIFISSKSTTISRRRIQKRLLAVFRSLSHHLPQLSTRIYLKIYWSGWRTKP